MASLLPKPPLPQGLVFAGRPPATFTIYISSFTAQPLPNHLVSPQKKRNTALSFQSELSTVITISDQPPATSTGKWRGRNLSKHSAVRFGLPSKGQMAEETLQLLKECQLGVIKPNARQYLAKIQALDNVEVWFQRENDVVRQIRTGDLDFGIVGYDTVCEYGQGDEDLIVVHDALGFGECRLAVAIPKYGIFENISSLDELAAMPQWTTERPLRVATGFTHLGHQFFKETKFQHVHISTADGALEAAPSMGAADVIIDLVGSGTTLHENSLKEIAGGTILLSQGVLVANKQALSEREAVLMTVREILERLEAHLRARNQFMVVANMRGTSEQDVAHKVLSETELHGLQGPTISPVYCVIDGQVKKGYYAIVICVAKNHLYDAIRQLRVIGGSGVLVSPLTYIFDETPLRWCQLLERLNLSKNQLVQ